MSIHFDSAADALFAKKNGIAAPGAAAGACCAFQMSHDCNTPPSGCFAAAPFAALAGGAPHTQRPAALA